MSFAEELLSVVKEWPAVWKSSTLWRMSTGDAVTPEDAAYAYLRYLASPSTGEEMFDALLDDGRFTAAESVLEHPFFREAAVDIRAAEDRLAERRMAMQFEVLAEWDDLTRRAGGVGAFLDDQVRWQFDDAYCLAMRDGHAALESLRPIRQLVEDAIDARLVILQARLDAAHAPSDEGAPENEWRKRVARAIARKRVDIAEGLLAAGPNAVLSGDYAVAPPMPIASFTRRYDPDQICRWSLEGQGGVGNFHQRFDPMRHGEQMKPFVLALLRLCSPQPEAGDVAVVIAELESLLNAAPAQMPHVVPFGEGYRTTLRGLGAVACDAFAANGIDVYVEPKGQKLNLPPNPARPAILLPVDRAIEAADGYVLLRPGHVLACVGYGSDLVYHLLRSICSQLSASRILDATPSDRWMADCDADDVPFGRLRTFAAQLFELHGFDVSDDVLDRVAFHAFGRPALLHALLRSLFLEIDARNLPRTARVVEEHVVAAHARREYLSAAREQFLSPIEASVDTRVVFATMLFIFDMHAGSRVGQV
jgi:hypothetical protein